MNRRRFICTTGGAAAALATSGYAGLGLVGSGPVRSDDIDAFILRKMEADHIPGVAAALVDRGGIVWENGYGWADLEARVPMTVDTLQNIASISKTFTTTALLQLRDAGLLDLDDDVNGYLPFAVVNPAHPDATITFRHLVTHVTSLRDGTSYSRLYACGDPKITLGVWMREYFTSGGAYYDADQNFERWAPGEQWRYCNVTYGLLGYLVERVSGMPFPEYCRRRIFHRLGMHETDWFISGIDASRHVVPYTWFEDGVARGPAWGGLPLGVIQDEGAGSEAFIAGGYRANCAYNHPNYPDGFLRTSVRQLARYAAAYLNGGILDGARIVSRAAMAEMFSAQRVEQDRIQGLTWVGARGSGEEDQAWGHGGSDPGVNTHLQLVPSRGVAAIVFTNTNGIRPAEITDRLTEEALRA